MRFLESFTKTATIEVSLMLVTVSSSCSTYDLIEKLTPRFRVVHTLTGARVSRGWKGSVGRISAQLLQDAGHGLERPAYYVCGMTPMVAEMVGLLSESGVPESDVRLEVFRGYRS